MKILIIDGFDYSVTHFKTRFTGTKVIDIINDLKTYCVQYDGQYDEEDWLLEVKEIKGPVSDEFISFSKSFLDYDSTKHKCWFTEHETI